MCIWRRLINKCTSVGDYCLSRKWIKTMAFSNFISTYKCVNLFTLFYSNKKANFSFLKMGNILISLMQISAIKKLLTKKLYWWNIAFFFFLNLYLRFAFHELLSCYHCLTTLSLIASLQNLQTFIQHKEKTIKHNWKRKKTQHLRKLMQKIFLYHS